MESYLSMQQSTIFQHVGVMIYVFDVESREQDKGLGYYVACLEALRKYSPEASVFLLVHKMDLVKERRETVMERRRQELQEKSGSDHIMVFGTSIYDESLYRLGLVAYRPHSHSQRGHFLATSYYLCRSLQRHGSRDVRANHFSRNRHLSVFHICSVTRKQSSIRVV